MSNKPTPEEAMDFLFDFLVHNHADLVGQWYGWKLRGRHLVTPAGDRLTPERLAGLVWRDAAELRLAGFTSRRKAEAAKRSPKVRVVVVDLQDYRERGLAAA
jgi:hypothetical protein